MFLDLKFTQHVHCTTEKQESPGCCEEVRQKEVTKLIDPQAWN